MKVRPLGDKLLIKRAEPETKTESGIYLPESAKDKPREGEVVAVGDGTLNRETGEYLPFTVKEGDRVIFPTYVGTEVKFDDEEFLIMSEEDILAVVEGK